MLLVVAAGVATTSGCQPKQQPAAPQSWPGSSSAATMEVIDPNRLHTDLGALINRYYSEAIGLSSDIAAKTDNRTVREQTLQWKLRVLSATQAILREPDPRLAFLFSWLLAEEGLYAATEGSRRSAFGEFQPQVVALLTRIRAELLELGYQHFDDAVIEQARDDLRDLASHDVLMQWRMSGSTQPPTALTAQRGRRNDLGTLLSIPMSPFTGLQGVAGTPGAISDASDVVAEIGVVIRNLPERVRWNAELLLYELDKLPSVAALQRDVDALNASVATVAARVDALPQDMRNLLDETEAAQPELRRTLTELRATTEQLNTLAASINTMSGSVQGAAAEINTMIGRDKKPGDPPPAPKPAAADHDPVTIGRLIELSEKITLAVKELRGLTGELEGPIAELDAASSRTVDRATDDLRTLLDAATWRLAGIVALAFVLAVIYRLVFRRASPR
jgi:outer membrane murein-binding lipoprotein Lpp